MYTHYIYTCIPAHYTCTQDMNMYTYICTYICTGIIAIHITYTYYMNYTCTYITHNYNYIQYVSDVVIGAPYTVTDEQIDYFKVTGMRNFTTLKNY